MKQLKKQWNKVTVLLLTFGIVFGLFGAMSVQAQDENASVSTVFDVKIVHTNDIHARVEEDDYNQVIGMDRLSGIAQAFTEGADGSLMLDSGYLSWTTDCDNSKGRIGGKTDESLWI